MEYFTGCSTADERKVRYRELAKKHHPDLGGDAEVMKEINSQYKGSVRASGPESNFYNASGTGFGDDAFGFDNWFGRRNETREQAIRAESDRRRHQSQDNFSWRFQDDPELKKREEEREQKRKERDRLDIQRREEEAREKKRQADQEAREWEVIEATLAPCVFCGHSKLTIAKENWATGYFVDCETCKATGPLVTSEEISFNGKAILAYKWNLATGREKRD